MSYLIAFAVGIVLGVVLSLVLLSEQFLVQYNKTSNIISSNYAAAKAVYKAEIYGTDTESEETEEAEETESEDEEE